MGRGPLVARERLTHARPRFVVDGYNVLLSPALPRRESMPVEAARTGLVGLLRTFTARERCDPPLIVVFDRRTGPAAPAERESPWLHVVHAPNADDWIVAWLAQAGDAAHAACVVSADRELAERARRAGATTESPARFVERLHGPRRARTSRRADAHGGKPAPPRGDTLLRDLSEQSGPREDDG